MREVEGGRGGGRGLEVVTLHLEAERAPGGGGAGRGCRLSVGSLDLWPLLLLLRGRGQLLGEPGGEAGQQRRRVEREEGREVDGEVVARPRHQQLVPRLAGDLVLADGDQVHHRQRHGDGRGVGVVGHHHVAEGDQVALPQHLVQGGREHGRVRSTGPGAGGPGYECLVSSQKYLYSIGETL